VKIHRDSTGTTAKPNEH